MEDIANKVGIKAPSIYKHFRGKEEIYSQILKNAEEDFAYEIEQINPNSGQGIEQKVDLGAFGKNIFNYLYHNEFATRVRKMLSIEMFRNPELTSMYIKHYVEIPLEKHFQLLEKMDLDYSIDLDSLAMAFYSPIYMSLRLCDAFPEREEEIVEKLENIYNLFDTISKNQEIKN